MLGLRIGLRPLGDNSLFWHLRTGIDIVATGSIPRTDPYSFTAAGDPWVVQSWLAEVTYGVADRLGGLAAVRIEHGLLYGLLAGLVGRLCRSGSGQRTALAGVLSLGVGLPYWSPRPLVFGLLGLAILILITESGRRSWLLVPVVWIWVNTHGSFVLGLVWLVLVAAGQWLDGSRSKPWKAIGWFLGGLAVACVNPLGPRLLAFPLTIVEKSEAFSHVTEWRPPTFRSPAGLVALICLVAIVALLVRGRRQVRWAQVVPFAGFVGLGLLAQRNLPMAAVVAAPALRAALRTKTLPPETQAFEHRGPLHVGIAGVLVALAALFVGIVATEPALDLEGYPVAASRLLPGDARIVTTDVAAGYLILARRAGAGVFIDDRVDLYPVRVTQDYVRLRDGHRTSLAILDRYAADAVLWETGKALSAQLAASAGWRRVGRAEGWDVYVRAEEVGDRR